MLGREEGMHTHMQDGDCATTSIRERVLRIITAGTGMEAESLDPDADIHTEVNLDSMQFIGIVARIEEELQIDLPMEVMTVSTLNQFVAHVEALVRNR